ncbi:MAG: hypothetical protein AVDCRST_MAG50-925 [uncultured Acidimicrobiales bacterium]|uniref:Glycosyltransferase RgtA/B/C/D-like domain-containing protein n=1 Tax=uncultured Acidimicrobiales bacterium TaxID=310071 RepID=A0A6J4H072_9ACTN|nr:MAG: hypothetical protein AVDCRST_MAG50-925 [uncultured Acidimicrobiales bacterium]
MDHRVEPAPPEAGQGEGKRRRPRSVAAATSIALLAALPALVSAVVLLVSRQDSFLPFGDHAVLHLSVRDVGRERVLLGPYSRFGFYHPGPLAAYLLSVPYRLLGGAHESLSIGALVINAASLGGIATVVHRRLGTTVALWTITVLAVTIRLVEPGFLRDSWNPMLPILPFLLAVLLGWAALCGELWALPLAVVPASLAVQSHVGYLAPVGAAMAVVSIGLLVRVVRQRSTGVVRGARGRRRLVALLLTGALGALVWLPPVIQQMTDDRGNAEQLLRYFRNASPHSSMAAGLRSVADELAKVPAYVLGVDPPDSVLLPQRWPTWAVAIGVAALVGAVVLAALRRRGDVVWLAALSGAVGLAGVAAVARIEGYPFLYVTRWTVVIGALAWTTVGAAVLPAVGAWLDRAADRSAWVRRPAAAITVVVAVLACGSTAVATAGSASADTPQTDYSGDLSLLIGAVHRDLLDNGILRSDGSSDVVVVEFAATTRADLVGTSFTGSGLVLGLVEKGADVQVSPYWEMPFGSRLTERVADARYLATIAYADGTSPPPKPGQRVLAVSGQYEVYGGMLAPPPMPGASNEPAR